MKAHFGPAIRSKLPFAAVFLLGLVLGTPARAVDGCKVLLCMAGNWQSIPECVPTVREALRDIARGRVWPTCGMSGDSDTANQIVAPAECPEQYRTLRRGANAGPPVYNCPFVGVIHVAVERQRWCRTWWSMDGDAVTEWLPAAQAALSGYPGAMDDRFDRDHAAWLLAQPVAPAGDPGHGG